MTKNLFLIAFLGLCSNSFAVNTACMNEALDVAYTTINIAEESKYSDEIKACLGKKQSFKTEVMDVMCKSDGSLTPEYETYRDYGSKFNQAEIERDNATTRAQKEFFNSELRAIRNQWIALGYKFELYPPLNLIFKLADECWVETSK